MNNMFLTATQLAIASIRRNVTRTVLTVLGIIIGISAVIVVMSAGQAIKGLIVGQLEAFGTNYIQIEVKTPQTEHTSADNALSMVGGGVITTLTIKDAEAVTKHPNVTTYYAGVIGQDLISYQQEIKKVMLYGVSAAYPEIDKSKIVNGRFFTPEEDDSLTKVAVLGSKVKEDLFGPNDPLGKNIRIGAENYRVIGVMDKRGATFGLDMDNMVLLPVQTLQKKILGIDYVMYIIVQIADANLMEQTAADIRDIMSDQHDITDPKDEDYAVTTQAEAMNLLGTVIVGIQALLIVLASISLVVGGIGIMNIMYVSVTERTYEIGLRKAIGARRRDIMLQFLIEAVIITMAGAIIGFMVGVLLSWLISIVATSQGFTWKFSISLSGVGLAVGMAVLVGVTFGLYPAKKASALEPITALRR